MTITPLLDLEYNTTNLADSSTPQWSETASYTIDTERQLENRLYKTLTSISALCEYVHDNSDLLNPNYVYRTTDEDEVIDNTAVVCEIDVTVIYNKDDNKYYLFDNSTGTTDLGGGLYEVDLTAQDPSDPANFTEVEGYRHLVYNPKDTPLIWQDLGYTNKYKCLDQSLSSQTVSDSSIDNGDITMTFIVNKVDEVHLMRIVGSSITVKVETTDAMPVELYNETTTLYNKNGGTFYNYFFNDFTYLNKLSVDIPIAFEVKVSITISNLANVAKVGLIGIGKSNYIGGTVYGASVGMIDFSKRLVNSETGESFLEQGNYKATNSLTVDIPSGLTDSAYNILIDYRAVPIIFRSNVYNSLVVFGIYNKFDIVLATPSFSRMSINIESLI